MKAKKKLSILLSALLTLNLLHIGGVKVKAEEVVNPITLKSVSVNSPLVLPGSEAVITVDASSSAGELENEASAILVQQSGGTETEKEITLTLKEGKYQANVPVAKVEDFGTYRLSFVIIADKLNNTQVFYNSKVHGDFGMDLSAANFIAEDDNTPPAAPKVTLSSKVLYAGNTLNITLESSDSASGLSKEANMVYVQKTAEGDVEKEVTLPLVNGKYVGSLKINDESEVGDWKISYVILTDNFGNVGMFYNSKVHTNVGMDLSSGDFAVKLDREGPVVNSVSISKGLVKLGDKTTVTVDASDCTGLAEEANLLYTITNGDVIYEQEVSLKLLDGKYQGEITLTDSFISGVWKISYIALQDSIGNSSAAYNSKLHGIGQDLSAADLTVDFDAPNKPSITLSTEAFTNQDVLVTIAAPEANAKVEFKLFNDTAWTTYTAPFSISANTIISARATDLAGNVSDLAVKYVTNIDKTAPVIVVEGVEDGKTYANTFITPSITATKNGVLTIKLDGMSYDGKSAIKSLGTHILEISAVDQLGNKSEKKITFTIEAVLLPDTSLADTIKDFIDNAAPGDKITVRVAENTILDTKVLEALKGIDRPISFVLESQGMKLTWTLNGKDIVKTDTPIDLSLNAVAPDKAIINKIDPKAVIFSFKNHGVLPVSMVVTLPVDASSFDVTKPLYFYHYNEATKKAELVGNALTAYKVGDNYFVDVTLTHNSDFFLSDKDSTTINKKVDELAKTGSMIDMNSLLVFGIVLMGLGAMMLTARRRRRTE